MYLNLKVVEKEITKIYEQNEESIFRIEERSRLLELENKKVNLLEWR